MHKVKEAHFILITHMRTLTLHSANTLRFLLAPPSVSDRRCLRLGEQTFIVFLEVKM